LELYFYSEQRKNNEEKVNVSSCSRHLKEMRKLISKCMISVIELAKIIFIYLKT